MLMISAKFMSGEGERLNLAPLSQPMSSSRKATQVNRMQANYKKTNLTVEMKVKWTAVEEKSKEKWPVYSQAA